MGSALTDLPVRSESRALAPAGTAGDASALLVAEAHREAWRLIEIASEGGRPLEASVSWTAGNGIGGEVKLSVARIARICVYARVLAVGVTNLSDEPNRAGVVVTDTFAVTRNQREQVGAGPGKQSFGVSACAERVLLELADPAVLSSTFVRVYDGRSVLRASHRADAQPEAGIPVGAARFIEIDTPSPVAWRLISFLII